jgi:hypothetical protein
VIVHTGAAGSQVSFTEGTITTAWLLLSGASAEGFAATPEITGSVVSLTVTIVVQPFELPESSRTLQLTLVCPRLKLEPEPGEQVGVPTPGRLSVAVGSWNVAAALPPPVHSTLTGTGHVICGFCSSLAVTAT